jgi:DNA polymerase-3 subunit delta'
LFVCAIRRSNKKAKSEDDAQEILKLSLKSYEGGYKIMIIWMADKLNIAASNKLLKLLEEPPEKTVFI